MDNPEFFFMDPDGTPPRQLLERLLEARQMENMHTQVNTHAVKDLFNSLTEDQLQALDLILANCNSASNVSYFRGQVTAVLQVKFEVCACGERHDISDIVPPEPVSESSDDLRNIRSYEEFVALCEEYGVTPEGGYPDPVTCDGCGTKNPSLKDRMLRKPGVEGCSGCQQKSAWG